MLSKRLFDILLSSIGIILLSPVLILVALSIKLSSKGPIIFKQERIGKNQIPFIIYKYRTMYTYNTSKSLLTVGMKDSRITKVGYYLRKYKIDELPQLFNVWLGDMSIVGPRPEVAKYVALYTKEQMQVLNVKPGISDEASIKYSNENEILAQYTDPEKAYIDIIMPDKLLINIAYVNQMSMKKDLQIIWATLKKVFK